MYNTRKCSLYPWHRTTTTTITTKQYYKYHSISTNASNVETEANLLKIKWLNPIPWFHLIKCDENYACVSLEFYLVRQSSFQHKKIVWNLWRAHLYTQFLIHGVGCPIQLRLQHGCGIINDSTPPFSSTRVAFSPSVFLAFCYIIQSKFHVFRDGNHKLFSFGCFYSNRL